MMNHISKMRVEKATIRTGTGGLGVTVPGGMILTAAHCLKADLTSCMGLIDLPLQTIECDGGQLKAKICAVEPIKDIAVFGAPDSFMGAQYFKDYFQSIRRIEPVEIMVDELDLSDETQVMIFTHKRTWVDATVEGLGDDEASLDIRSEQQIEGGTSGGPVVDKEGRLLGVVSTASISTLSCDVVIPRPHLALPVWVVRIICDLE